MIRELYDLPEDDRVCRAFASAAYLTWGELRDFGELEEGSITDYRLLHLKRMCPDEVTIIKFPKRREARTGADWEWWFGCQNEWFGMRVQAKRLDLKSLEYSQLGHTIGRTRARQIDRLLTAAQEGNLYPLYCFYNYWDSHSQIEWPCRTFARNTELWGASVADAHAVRKKLDQGIKKLAGIAGISMPLMCLACCRGHAGGRPNPTLPHRARGVAGVLRGNPSDVPPLVPHLPWYATHRIVAPRELPTSVIDLAGILVVEERLGIYDE